VKADFDFHIHTSASDGSLSPCDVVRKVQEEHLRVIAITDHDTISGVGEALVAAQEFGIKVIAGVEMSVEFSPGTMHLCGYFIDVENKELAKGLEILAEGRVQRNPQIIKKLNEQGVQITIDEVTREAGKEHAGRPHIAQVLVKKGYVSKVKEAFDKFLAKGGSCYVERKRLLRRDAIRLIGNAGGLSVLAHPGELKLKDSEDYRTLFTELRKDGILGIEAFSSHHTEEENQFFQRLADELGMFVVGGSDFHGETKPTIQLGEFAETVSIDLDSLLQRMQHLRAKGGRH